MGETMKDPFHKSEIIYRSVHDTPTDYDGNIIVSLRFGHRGSYRRYAIERAEWIAADYASRERLLDSLSRKHWADAWTVFGSVFDL